MTAAALLDEPVPMPRGRRRTALLMLAFGLAVVLLAFISSSLGLSGKISGLPLFLLVYIALMLAAHAAVRQFAPYADPLLLPLAALLNGLGLVMIYRLQESGRNGNPGLLVGDLTSSATTTQVRVDRGRRGRHGRRAGGDPRGHGCCSDTPTPSARWPDPAGPPGGADRQPRSTGRRSGSASAASRSSPASSPGSRWPCSSPAYLVAKRDALALAGRRFLGIDLPRGSDLGRCAAAWLASLLILIFETDIGTSALFFGLFVAMLYIATQRTSWLLIGILLFLVGAFVTAQLFGT